MKFGQSLMKMTAAFALVLTVLNVNAACAFVMHQPEIPASAMKFKK